MLINMVNMVHGLAGLCFYSLLVFGSSRSVNSRIHSHNPNLEIIGGREATPYSVPEMVFLLSRRLNATTGEDQYSKCGGTLLSHNYVLTAANCLNETNGIEIGIGVHNITTKEDGAKYIEAKNWTIHPTADIAIIRLPEPVDYSNHIQPVILPTRDEAAKNWEYSLCETYGWGKAGDIGRPSDVLRIVSVMISELAYCRSILKPDNVEVVDGNMCTVAENHGFQTGICNGDAGGPLFMGLVQLGVASYVNKQCEKATMDVYVIVGDYLDWIAQNSDVVIS